MDHVKARGRDLLLQARSWRRPLLHLIAAAFAAQGLAAHSETLALLHLKAKQNI